MHSSDSFCMVDLCVISFLYLRCIISACEWCHPREIGMCLCGDSHCHVYTSTEGRKLSLWEMDYVDFCFLANKWYHGIPSFCSKLLMNFQRKSHNLRALLIILRARFWQKHYFQQNETCRNDTLQYSADYYIEKLLPLGLHDIIVELNSTGDSLRGFFTRSSVCS